MLSKNTMVKARKALETLYDGLCTVTEYQEYVRENKSTGHKETIVLEGQQCRLSFSSSPNTNPSDTASKTVQTVRLFIAPKVSIKAGSKISVTQNGITTDYKSSGEPMMYDTHQEIDLELFDGWT